MSEVSVLLSVDEAVGRVLLAFSPLETVRVSLSDCYGLVLSEDVLAKHDVPIDDNSAYDGYGVRAADIAAAGADNPIRLRVAYDLAAGYVGDAPVGPGEAVRIMTGAPVPDGVDTVIGFEYTDREDWGKLGTDPRGDSDQDRAFVNVVAVEEEGENIRLAGEDIAAGDVALPMGTVLRAGAIGVLASLGISQVPVHRRPRVAVVPTGDEVLEVDEDIQPGKVRNSHAWALAGLVDHYGAEAKRYPIVPDNVADVRAALALAAAENDLIFTIGGVSMGDHDLVKNVVGTDGDADFWQIAMRPGKPLLFGDIDGTPTGTTTSCAIRSPGWSSSSSSGAPRCSRCSAAIDWRNPPSPPWPAPICRAPANAGCSCGSASPGSATATNAGPPASRVPGS